MMKKILCFIVIVLSFLILQSCGVKQREWLDVPFICAQDDDYCCVACIQMWAWYDGNTGVTQDEIAWVVGAPTLPDMAECGVNEFTNSMGWLEKRLFSPTAQDECIAASIAAYKEKCPSIMPFYGGQHAVLTIGYKSHEEGEGEDKRPVADYMWYHDPAPWLLDGECLQVSAHRLKTHYFTLSGVWYFVIVGSPIYVQWGLIGYDEFLDKGGSFYGGPDDYDPFVFQQ